MADLLLRCGCVVKFLDGEHVACTEHGEQSVARVLRMPAPRFRGVATGPHAITTDVAPFVGKVE